MHAKLRCIANKHELVQT